MSSGAPKMMKAKRRLRCPDCDNGRLESRLADLTGTRKGESFSIRMRALCCDKCDFKTIAKEHAAQFALRTANAYRKAHGLLTSMEIRDIRSRLKMSQAQFAKFLEVGVASVKRWELGEIQDAAMNRLIHLAVSEAERKHQQWHPWGSFDQLHGRMELQPYEPPATPSGMPHGPPPNTSKSSPLESILQIEC
jgi:putative zinc finger/helix-turn-helix YgiT family protein